MKGKPEYGYDTIFFAKNVYNTTSFDCTLSAIAPTKELSKALAGEFKQRDICELFPEYRGIFFLKKLIILFPVVIMKKKNC